MAIRIFYLQNRQTSSDFITASDPPEFALTVCAHIDELIQLDGTPDSIVVIGQHPPSTIVSWVAQLRQHHRFAVSPLFISFPGSDTLIALTDGVVDSYEQLTEASSKIVAQIKRMPKLVSTATPTLCLLAYLNARPGRHILPQRCLNSAIAYEYPQANLFFNESEKNQMSWLDGIIAAGLLDRGSLVNKLRCCTFCDSAHLNYHEECPECSSINIELKPFIHCFTCGRIFAQEEFIASDKLLCTKCNARLRHIGIDYDRPLENYVCNACSAQFVDATTKIQCLACGQDSDPDKTHVRLLHELHLSDKGSAYVLDPDGYGFSSLFIEKNLANLKHFSDILNWYIMLQNENDQCYFSLIAIQSPDFSEYELPLSARNITPLLNKTDIMTIDIQHRALYILMPQRNLSSSSNEILFKDIKNKLIGNDQQNIPDIHTRSYSSYQENNVRYDAELLLTRILIGDNQ